VPGQRLLESRNVRAVALAGLSLLAAGAITWLIVSRVTAAGSHTTVVDFPAAAFTPAKDSTHNNMGTSVCAAPVINDDAAPELPSENRGDLNTTRGSFLEGVQLPQRARVERLTLFVNDNDGVEPGLSPQFKGYTVMAKTQSQGAVLNTMRRFSDHTITGARINNRRYYYYLELINCATVEPFDVQVEFGK
jgi:hypothetical protein